jgi:hypothetical protein
VSCCAQGGYGVVYLCCLYVCTRGVPGYFACLTTA